MGISIKNDEVEALARELAGRRQVSITEAIRQSLRREVERERLVPRKSDGDLLAELVEISDRASALVRPSNLSDDEILGYDEFGAPTR
ncbi:type II toxin-antitoxin system VapB family antitoxin [Arvimicrobium flavum]|uniref:type II toxin-antitoxin system VapB family antitoxin n=1 Tax=Arvimicrobium flavum TaxID=3393320 RepID=UPI00237A21F3|nr:type II toxin-antitoxin system VapB family antitoxin [Mesorhizobium shangrilense]